MSLSNKEVSISSPVKRYYYWSGSEGKLTYWDSQKGEKVTEELPFKFIPIDQLSCVEGFSIKHDRGFRSNEVKSTAKEELEVKINGGATIARGLYSDIKDQVEKLGGKYHRSIYGVQLIDGNLEIINIRFKGAAMSSWLNFDRSTKMSIDGLELTITRSDMKKTGKVEYYEPQFSAQKPSEEDHAKAVELDIELQEYFKIRKSGVQESEFLQPLTDEEKSQLRKPKAEKVKVQQDTSEFGSMDDFFNQ